MRRLALWGFLALLLFSCERWLESCFGLGTCLGPAAPAGDWATLAIAAGGLLVAVSGLALVLRTAWLALRSALAVNRLHLSPAPGHIDTLARALGIRRLHFIDEDVCAAFCAGVLRPTVYIGRGLLGRIDQPELHAVLVHEMDHARRFEPLWRTAWRAAAEIGFFVPLMNWARAHEIERSELQADRHAVAATGAQAVAGAIWALGSGPAPLGVAAFSETIDLRVAQLLGDPMPRRRPHPDLLLSSVLGTVVALAVMGCIAEIFGLALG